MAEETPTSDSPPVDQEWREKVVAALADLPARREEMVRELEAMLPTFNTFDLLAWVSLNNLLIDPENYHEGESGGVALRIEYLTLLSLINGFQPGTTLHPTLEQYKSVAALVDSISSSVIVDSIRRQLAVGPPGPDELAMLAGNAHLNEMFVRVPGYPHHQERLLRGVFSPFDNDLRAAHGFGAEDAITLYLAIKKRYQQAFENREEGARDDYKQLERLAKSRRHSSAPDAPPGLTDEVIVAWSRLSNKDLRKMTRGAARITAMANMGEALRFTAEELATDCGLTLQVTEGFLKSLSLRFGDVDNKYRHPKAVHPVKDKPLIHHGGHYFTSVPDQPLWAIQSLFQRTLMEKRKTAFEQHRHRWLLAEMCRLLKRIMPTLAMDNELRYPVPAGSAGELAELDALGRYDSALFFIEVKAASIRSQARMGFAEPFQDEMEKVLRTAHEQALRANENLGCGGVFTHKDGTAVVINVADFTRFFLIGVTLEHLGFLTARMDAANPFALSDERLLFAVGIHDLMVMADCLEGFAPWFPHYMVRRLRIARQRFLSAGEELDLFCYYMDRGLYHEGPQDFGDADEVSLGTWTDKLDEYYFYKEGVRKKPAPLPQPKASHELREFVNQLDSSQLRNRLDAILAVIEMDEESRTKFLAMRRRARRLHNDDLRPHDFSMASTTTGSWGITVAVGTPKQLAGLNLPEYVERKRRETGVKYWVLVTETGKGKPLGIQLTGQTPRV